MTVDPTVQTNTHKPRLSLGLPVYNGEQFLHSCLDSLLGQTFKDFELIVCDNASTDSTVEIVKEYAVLDPRIQLHCAKFNRGAAPNFNWAFELATGELFKWCAADDVHQPEFLECCVAALDTHSDVVLAWSGALDIDENGVVLKEIYDNSFPMRFDSFDVATRFQDLVCWDHSCISVFGVVRAQAMRSTSLIGSYVGSDRTFLAELGLQGRLFRVGDDLMLHREHIGRSVNEIADLRARTVWFDVKSKGVSFPHWRLMGGYFDAIVKSELPIAQKVKCLAGIARWLKWGAWRNLQKDISYNIRGMQ